MLDTQAVLAQVEHGEVRREWLVVHTKDESGKFIISLIFIGLMWTMFLLFIILVIMYSSMYVPSYDPSSDAFRALLFAPWFWLPAIGLGFLPSWFIWRIEKNKGDAIIVFLPEGFIVCDLWSKPSKRVVKTFAYGDFETMTLRIGGTIPFVLSSGELRLEDAIEKMTIGAFIFDFMQRDGRKREWAVDKQYNVGGGNMVVRRIVYDHRMYAQRSAWRGQEAAHSIRDAKTKPLM
jgi:hypothetical protein